METLLTARFLRRYASSHEHGERAIAALRAIEERMARVSETDA